MELYLDIEEYYKKYGPMVFRRCLALLKNEEKAVEAMHDVFVQLMKYKDRIKDQYPSSLLFRIATNICINLLHVDKKTYNIEDIQIPYGNLDKDLIDRNLLSRLFCNEKETTATIAVMFYLDGMTLEETAKEVGLSVSGVRKRLRHLGEKLKKIKEVL
jgi:RNA polymerase sigma-70 factor, ECF subfamily